MSANRIVRVLIIEDNPTDRLLLEDALNSFSDLSVETTRATRLGEAIALLGSSRVFDAIVLDLGLPDSRGIETFQRLYEVVPDTPILVLTGLDDDASGIAALKGGAEDYLLKRELQSPVLSRTLRYAIERNEARRSVELTKARQAEIEEQLRQIQRLESLGTLAGGIAHDLNNTLVPIKTMASLLLRENPTRQDRKKIELISSAAQRAATLVREVLAFGRRQPLLTEVVQLDQVVRDSLTMIRAGIPPRVRIISQLDIETLIQGNSGQIYQIVLNLVTNAAQAIGQSYGSVSVGVDLEPDGTAPDVPVARLTVVDDGPGMDDATCSRIFEPFFTTKAASGGSGLGLSVVQGIVAEHRGKITVKSEIGKGTRFDVFFPRLQADPTIEGTGNEEDRPRH